MNDVHQALILVLVIIELVSIGLKLRELFKRS